MYHNAAWWFSSPLIVGWGVLVVLFAVWSLYWQGRALWKAARLGHLGWFIALLLIHTGGILDILYIYVFSKPKMSSTTHEHNHDHGHDHAHHDHNRSEATHSDQNS